MSEELVILKEYCESLGIVNKKPTEEDLKNLRIELKEAGELGLSNFIASLGSPEELLEYLE